jgi:hypothetical protein
VLSGIRNRKIEAEMLQFMNIIDNFSKTSDDLIEILERSSRYIDDPLGSQIYDAVQEARNTGDTLLALQDLQNTVQNKHFKMLIRNLETSSRFENNYSDIVEDCRNVFHEYIRAQKEKRSLRLNGMIEVLIMVATGFASIIMIGQMLEDGNIMDALLNNGITGVIIFWILIGSLALSIYIAVFKIMRETK